MEPNPGIDNWKNKGTLIFYSLVVFRRGEK
jgi:hypothetical protein